MATATLARPAGHPFYERLNVLLDKCSFDEFVEDVCRRFYAENMGRPGLSPGMYFGCCCSDTSRESIASGESPGEQRIR